MHAAQFMNFQSVRVLGLLRSPLDIRPRVTIGLLFSPHPGPLPQGEGTASDYSFCAWPMQANPPLGSSQNRSRVLPLPWGEGQGEGELSVVYPTDQSVRDDVGCLLGGRHAARRQFAAFTLIELLV